MTSIVLSVALVFTPSPLTAPKEAPQWQSTLAIPADTRATTSFVIDDLPMAEWLTVVETIAPAASVSELSLPPPPPIIYSPIEAGLNRLAELGATPYQLRVFGCLAWFESRNDPYAVSRTNDRGLWQISTYWHSWRWRGRDIFDPIVNAEVAWDIYQGSGFRAWTTHWSCGV